MSSGQRSSSSGGVRNLRAMFENKAEDPETSTPSRGRSPSGSVTSNVSNAPRPLSKVRTNFVAVERGGQLGLFLGPKKVAGGESSIGPSQIPSSNANEGNDRQSMAEE